MYPLQYPDVPPVVPWPPVENHRCESCTQIGYPVCYTSTCMHLEWGWYSNTTTSIYTTITQWDVEKLRVSKDRLPWTQSYVIQSSNCLLMLWSLWFYGVFKALNNSQSAWPSPATTHTQDLCVFLGLTVGHKSVFRTKLGLEKQVLVSRAVVFHLVTSHRSPRATQRKFNYSIYSCQWSITIQDKVWM